MIYGSVLFLAWIIQNLRCDVKIIEFFVVMSVLWRKGANWFAPVARARSVGLSVDEVMSAQYFLTLCLKVAKRWWMPLASRWPQLFCGHVVKGQGLTAGLWENVRSMSFDTFARKSPNSVQWMPLERFPYWYSDHMAKGQDRTPKFCLIKILWFKLWIKGKLSTAHHRNASQNIVVYFAIRPSRS